jgi:hypothetical protein
MVLGSVALVFPVIIRCFIWMAGGVASDRLLGADEIDYLSLTINWFTQGTYVHDLGYAYRLPGYPLFLAPAVLFSVGTGFPYLDGIMIWQIAWAGFGGWLLWRLSTQFCSIPVQWGITGFYGIYPPLVVLSYKIMAEGFFLVIILLIVWAWMRVVQTWQARAFLLLGVFFAIACLTRSEAFLFLLPIATFICVFRPLSLRSYLRRALFVLIPVLIALSPWVIRNTILFGKPLLSTTLYSAFYAGYNPYSLGTDFPLTYPEIPLTPAEFQLMQRYFAPVSSPQAELEKGYHFWEDTWRYIHTHPRDILVRVVVKPYFYWLLAYRDFKILLHVYGYTPWELSLRPWIKYGLTLIPLFILLLILLHWAGYWREPRWYVPQVMVGLSWIIANVIVTTPRFHTMLFPILLLQVGQVISNRHQFRQQIQRGTFGWYPYVVLAIVISSMVVMDQTGMLHWSY